MGPLNSPAIRLCRISPPIVLRRGEAPITATDSGASTLRTAATAAVRSRSSNRSIAAGDSEVGSSISSTSGARPDLDREPALAEDVDHAVVVGKNLGHKGRDAVLLGHLREVGQQDGRDAATLPGIGHQEGDLGPGRVDPHIYGVRHDRSGSAALDDQAEPVRIIDVHRPLGGPVDVGGAEEAEADRLGRDGLEEGPDRRTIVGPDRPDVDRRAVPEDDLRLSVRRIPCRGGLGDQLSA